MDDVLNGIPVEPETEGKDNVTYINGDHAVSEEAVLDDQQPVMDDLEADEVEAAYTEVVTDPEADPVSGDMTYNVAVVFVLSMIVGLLVFHSLSRRWQS
jgi:hypothetical protein